MWVDYVFYTTDESFDYPTGYGYATHYEKAQHGFSVKFDKNDNVLDWRGMGDYWQADEAKTLEEFYNFVKSVKSEYAKQDVIDELLEFISQTIRTAA